MPYTLEPPQANAPAAPQKYSLEPPAAAQPQQAGAYTLEPPQGSEDSVFKWVRGKLDAADKTMEASVKETAKYSRPAGIVEGFGMEMGKGLTSMGRGVVDLLEGPDTTRGDQKTLSPDAVGTLMGVAAPELARRPREGVASSFGPGSKPPEPRVDSPIKAPDIQPDIPADEFRKRFAPSGEVPETGPVLELPKEGESGAAQVTRIDDGLFRLQKHATADKVEAAQFLRGFSDEHIDPELQEKAYTEVEARMANPGAKLSPEVEGMITQSGLKPWMDEQTERANRIKEKLAPESVGLVDLPSHEEGYVHRVAKGHEHPFDQMGEGTGDPIIGSPRNFSKKASSLEGRKFFVEQTPEGRRWVGEVDPKKKPPPGKLMPATTAEIEANTPVRYHKNLAINTVENVLRLRRVERNIDTLATLKDELYQKDQFLPYGTQHPIPKDWQPVHIPQMMGYAHPKIAQVLRDFYNPEDHDFGWIGRVNRALTGTLFYTPFPHAMNVLTHWAVGRGWDWMKPGGYRDLAQTSVRAVRSVLAQDDLYKAMLREGGGLQYADAANENFYAVMIEKLGREQIADPQTWGGIAKKLNFKTVRDMVKWEYKASSKALWAANDVFMMQRYMELMKRGMNTRQAIKAAERDIPNYRIPPEVMNSRALASFLKSPNYVMFGRYKYGQAKAYGAIVHDMLKGEAGDKKEAAGKLLVLLLMAGVVYPLADHALRSITGNKNASAQRFGPFGPPQAIVDLTDGQRDFVSAMASIITPSPLIDIGKEILTDKNDFGQDIVQPGASTMGKVLEGAEGAAEHVAPLGQAVQMTKPGGTKAVVARQFGVKLPSKQSAAARRKAQNRNRGVASRRESRDQIERWIKRQFQ